MFVVVRQSIFALLQLFKFLAALLRFEVALGVDHFWGLMQALRAAGRREEGKRCYG